eukprot:COSAG01_NODE_4485_length_4983_cov_3.863432_9_plen_36_part_01
MGASFMTRYGVNDSNGQSVLTCPYDIPTPSAHIPRM